MSDFDELVDELKGTRDMLEIVTKQRDDALVDVARFEERLATSIRVTDAFRNALNASIERQRRNYAKLDAAQEIAVRYGGFDSADHKAWTIDQMVRALTGENYADVVADACSEDGDPEAYTWDEGIAP